SRLARGRDLLRKRLARQGLASAGVLALGPQAAQAVPPPLCDATVQAAVRLANGAAPAVAGLTPNVIALMEGVLKAMLLAKLRPVVLVLALLLLGAALWMTVPLRAGQTAAGQAS